MTHTYKHPVGVQESDPQACGWPHGSTFELIVFERRLARVYYGGVQPERTPLP
jgi:hypothetical protein